MKLGLKVAGIIAGSLLVILLVTKCFGLLNLASDAMVVVGIVGLLVILVALFTLGGYAYKHIKKITDKE